MSDLRQKVQSLDAASLAAKKELARLRSIREREESKELIAARAAVVAKYDERFGSAISAAHESALKAQQELDAAKIELAKSEDDGFPIGSKVWRYSFHYDGWRYSKHPSGVEVGVVEVWTNESEAPESQRYGFASVGEKVVRPLLKSGKPGKKAVRLRSMFSDKTDWTAGEPPQRGADGRYPYTPESKA